MVETGDRLETPFSTAIPGKRATRCGRALQWRLVACPHHDRTRCGSTSGPPGDRPPATGAGRVPPVGEADFGTVVAGMSADLIVLNADPLADIRNTLQIDRVMLRGEWVDRDALLPSP